MHVAGANIGSAQFTWPISGPVAWIISGYCARRRCDNSCCTNFSRMMDESLFFSGLLTLWSLSSKQLQINNIESLYYGKTVKPSRYDLLDIIKITD